MMEDKLVNLLMEMGVIDGTVYSLAMIVVIQAWKYREQLTFAWFGFIGRLTEAIVQWIQQNSEKQRERMNTHVSDIYTHMFRLMEMAPIRVMLIRFSRKKHKQGDGKKLEIRIEHEAVKELPPIKPFFEGILAERQLSGYVNMLLAEQGGEHILHSMDELEDGDYKDLLLSVDVRAVVNTVINHNKRVIWILSVHFNRENPVDPPFMARIRLCAANIRKIISV